MTAKELITAQLDDTKLQVSKVFEGIPEDGWDQSSNPQAMSPRQTLGHLTECCMAMLAEDPHTYEWGSFDASGLSHQELMAKYNDLRAQCVQKCTESSEDEVINSASNFIALHEAYHVGQLATLRLALDPDWNAYSIYGME